MKRIGVVAALPGELRPLVKDWPRRGDVFAGRIGDMECVAVAAGIGAAAATRACEAVFREEDISALVSMGWAGALSCGVKPGQAYEVAEVIDSRTGERFATASETPGSIRLVTLDHVARGPEKRRLAERYQASIVDMEAATIGRLARARNVPFYCWKGISDGANDLLPDFNRFLSSNHQLRMTAFVTYAMLHPKYWRSLVRLRENSSVAAVALAAMLMERWNHGDLYHSG